MSRKRTADALEECYRRLYKAATPSADYDKLKEEALKGEPDEDGIRHFPFEQYVLDGELYDEIVDEVASEYKLRGSYLKAFRFQAYLGIGPTTKRDNFD